MHIRFFFLLCRAHCHCLRKFVNVRHALLISVFFSNSDLVRSDILYSINFGRYNSVISRNLCTVCKLFNWLVCDFILGRVCLSQRFFTAYYKIRLSVGESTTVSFMSELLKLGDNYLCCSGIFHLDRALTLMSKGQRSRSRSNFLFTICIGYMS